MKRFLDDNFLLETETAEFLFHTFAKEMPILDYHCHLSAKEIAENKTFANLSEIWLTDDHYKWRAMRANGIEEEFITGANDDKEKFIKWAETVPLLIGNPLYHWTHLELMRYFGITEPLHAGSAEIIWETCNRLLRTESFSVRQLITRSNVKALCTTDDPLDDLSYHQMISDDAGFDVAVLPTFRPDGALAIDSDSFPVWIGRLEEIIGLKINRFGLLVEGLKERVKYFHAHGCKLSDHGLDSPFYLEADEDEIERIFQKGLMKKELVPDEVTKYQTALLRSLGKIYKEQGWAMQLHIGALRNTNSKKWKAIGPNAGFDSIADFTYATDLATLLDSLTIDDHLPKTIIYNLNPKDNYMVAAMIGNFQEECPGKVQFGTAWWFSDQRDGMENQMKTLANCGLLSHFVGMVTDSRSYLSYTRHEYFRRILCNLLGKWVENGEYPADFETLGQIVEGICCRNAERYLAIKL